MPFRTPASLAHVIRLVGMARVLWMAFGQVVATTAPRVCSRCIHKGPRLFLLRVGISFVATRALRISSGVGWIRAHLSPPWLRGFLWPQAGEAPP
jgi:hypothetical protein